MWKLEVSLTGPPFDFTISCMSLQIVDAVTGMAAQVSVQSG